MIYIPEHGQAAASSTCGTWKKHPEVEDHRKQVIGEVCDEAVSNIVRAVMAGNLYASLKWLKTHHPDWA
jgi:hypothetical protein